MENKLVFTMHIRGPIDERPFRLDARLSYEDQEAVDRRSLEFVTREEPDA